MDHQLTGHLTWSTDSTIPGWQLTIEAGPGQPATRLSLGAHVAQDASQQELQTLLAEPSTSIPGPSPTVLTCSSPSTPATAGPRIGFA
jgi:hypothetical protein